MGFAMYASSGKVAMASRKPEKFEITAIEGPPGWRLQSLDGIAVVPVEEFLLTLGRFQNGRIAEVFIDVPLWSGKSTGSLSTLVAKDVALIISIALQHGATVAELAEGMGRGEVNWMGRTAEMPHTMIGTILTALVTNEVQG